MVEQDGHDSIYDSTSFIYKLLRPIVVDAPTASETFRVDASCTADTGRNWEINLEKSCRYLIL